MAPKNVPPKTTQVYVFKINAYGREGQSSMQIYCTIGSKFGANQHPHPLSPWTLQWSVLQVQKAAAWFLSSAWADWHQVGIQPRTTLGLLTSGKKGGQTAPGDSDPLASMP